MLVCFFFFGAGSVASGDPNFISIPKVDLTSDAISHMDSSTNDANPFSSINLAAALSSFDLQGLGASRRYEAEPTTSTSSEQKGVEPMKKRKQSQVTLALEDYKDFWKKQSTKLVEELKESKQEDVFSIGNCVAALRQLKSYLLQKKMKALRLFEYPMNRDIFIDTKNPSLRIFWLKEEITAMERT